MVAFLRYAPADDQRPEPLCPAVLARATTARLDEIRAWIKPRLPGSIDEQITFALSCAMKAGGADGFRAAMHLYIDFKWPVDMELCQFVRDTCNALAFALRAETRVWSVRVGLRFPGRSEHRIEWIDDTGNQIAGKVISVDDTFAAAIVQAYDGTIRMGPPRRVFAEHVIANTTLGLYAGVSTEPAPKFSAITPEIERQLMAGVSSESRLPIDPDCAVCSGEGVIPLPDQDFLGENCPNCDGSGKAPS